MELFTVVILATYLIIFVFLCWADCFQSVVPCGLGSDIESITAIIRNTKSADEIVIIGHETGLKEFRKWLRNAKKALQRVHT